MLLPYLVLEQYYFYNINIDLTQLEKETTGD